MGKCGEDAMAIKSSPEVEENSSGIEAPPLPKPVTAALQLRPSSLRDMVSNSGSFGKAAEVAMASAGGSGANAGPRAAPQTFKGRLQKWRRQAARIWWELPTACRATLIIAVINFCLSVGYAVSSVALTTADEELHITIIILISAVFVVVSVADAIVYENTLELATSIIIDTLVLARVIFFALEGNSHEAFKITFCTLMLIVQGVYIVAAILAYREFGWRLYSKLGVDFREKGAAHKMRMAILRNSYATLLKINAMLLLVLVAVGIDVSVEKRSSVLGALLGVSIAGLFVGAAATWLAVLLVLKPSQKANNLRLLVGFHAAMPLAMAQPIAAMVIYQYQANDAANASTSLHVSAVVYMVASLGVWVSTHFMHKRVKAEWRGETSRVVALSGGTNGSVALPGDPLLACMHAGAWIGKPTARNPYRVRFFQLSYDGSTLRWGWNKFVRLYYIDDLAFDDVALTITLAFPFDAELVLKFKDASTYHAWRRGMAHLLLMLMAPDVPPPPDAPDLPLEGQQSRRVLMGSTTSRELVGLPGVATLALVTGSPASAVAPAATDAPMSARSARGLWMLSQLGVRVQQMGRRLRSGRTSEATTAWQGDASAPGTARRQSDMGASSEGAAGGSIKELDEEANGSPKLPARSSGSWSFSQRHKRSPQGQPAAAAAEQEHAAKQQRLEEERSLQMQKRQKMVAYLQSIANAATPTLPRPRSRSLAAAAAAPALRPGPGAAGGSAVSRRSSGSGLQGTSVSVAVQTDDSELLQLASFGSSLDPGPSSVAGSAAGAYGSVRCRASSEVYVSSRRLQDLREEEEDAEPPTPSAAPGPAAAAGPSSDGYDAEVAAQYAAAMAAAAGATAGRQPRGAALEAAPQPAAGAAAAAPAGGDEDVAAQYMAAMAAAAGAGGWPAAASQQPAPQQQQQQQVQNDGDAGIASQYAAAMGPPAGTQQQRQQQQQHQQQMSQGAGGDEDIAAQYMAAMAAAAVGTPPLQPQAPPPLQGPSPGGAVGVDSDLAAQYLMAMQAAAVGGSPEGRTYQEQQQQQQGFSPAMQQSSQAMVDGLVAAGATPRGATPRDSLRQLAGRRSFSASPASPLEQLAWQQQQAASARMAASLTPGSARNSQAVVSTAGGGLWQLAAAVDVIDYEELSFGKLLGAGAEGAVYAAWFLESPVAVKKFERAEDSLHEVEMYLQLGSHDNVVALRGLCQHDGSMFLVLEYCPRGTLDVMLHHSAKHRWDPQKLLPLVRSIARGMHYLHSRHILHRDLKPANIFVGHGQLMKIGDFGMARIVAPVDGPPNLRRLTPGTVGTVQYCAPELINEDLRPEGSEEMEWALKLDVWSFGVTLWEILERRRPFEGLSQNAVQALWMSDPYAARLPPVRLPDSKDQAAKRIYRGLSDLVEDCTRLDPFARPSSRDILLRLKSLAAFAERKDMAML